MKYQAAVLREVGGPLGIETVEVGQLRPHDVLVKVHAAGLCHTDLETIQGSLVYPLPLITGHEGAGVVEAVGSSVSQVAPGDHVVLSWNPSCGHCYYCDRDQPILCEPLKMHQPKGELIDGGRRLKLEGGEDLYHFMMTNCHGEYTVVPEAGAIPVPREMPFAEASLIGCGVMTGVGAALNVARMKVGESAVVIGCGGVGFNAVQGARLARAHPIIAVDINPMKLEQARLFGATHVIDARDEGAAAEIRAITGGRGADVAIEAGGNEACFRLAFEAVRPGGQVVLLGKVNVDREVSFRWGTLMGEKRMIRSSYGNTRPREDFPMLARLFLEGELNLSALVSDRIPLSEINRGFERLEAGEVIRSVVEFD